MNVTMDRKEETLVVTIEGRMDTITSPQLEKQLHEIAEDVTKLVMDIKDVEYVSSAGLRVLLGAQKMMMSRSGSMVVRNVSPIIMEIFEVTSFVDILTIE